MAKVQKELIPEMEGLFTWPSDEPRLIAGRCKTCGSCYFPYFYETHSPDCTRRDVEEVLLSRKGILRSYTMQLFLPPPPYKPPKTGFVPYAVGLVEFPEGINIPGQLTGCGFDDIKVGMEVEVTAGELYEDEEGNGRLTFRFRPTGT